MNKQEILRHITGFCPDITIDDNCVFTDNNFVCGLEIQDDTIVLFYPHYNKVKRESFTDINNYDDIIMVWNEYRYRLGKSNAKMDKLRNKELRRLIQGGI